MDCVFCKIVGGQLPANILYQDDRVIAVDDIQPKAPTHKLILPRKHIATLNDLTEEDTLLVGHIIQTAKLLAKELGIAEEGYRTVFNCNSWGGQVVFHLHLHLLGGRAMQWPPG